MVLTPGPPPPADPPLEILQREAVPTDPRKRIFALEEEVSEGLLRLVWDADDPLFLEAELRQPRYGGRLPIEQLRGFWASVKARTASLGPLPIDGADPRP